LDAQKDGLDSNEYEDALSSVLEELYELVRRPPAAGGPEAQPVKRTTVVSDICVFALCSFLDKPSILPRSVSVMSNGRDARCTPAGYQYSGDNPDFGNGNTHYVPERLRDHRFAHIVCYEILEPGKPFDASFMPCRENPCSTLSDLGFPKYLPFCQLVNRANLGEH
jgi:hypothetical protein